MNRLLTFGFWLLLLILTGSLEPGRADTFKNPERTGIDQVGMAMSLHAQMNSGQVPTRWEQIETIYNLDRINNNLARSKRAPLNERYQFLPQKIATLDGRGRLLLIRSIPLERVELDDHGKEKRVRWRYMVTRGKNGTISATRVPEEEVQAIFQKAGIPLPTPNPREPAVETEDIMPPQDGQLANDPESREGADGRQSTSAPSSAAVHATTPMTQTPAVSAKRRSSALSWIAGIAALLVIAALALKRRS